jgi:hypothetical protein
VSIDWNVVASALHDSRDGHSLKALAVLSGLMSEAESDIDRAVILLGESSCYAQLGNIAKSRKLLESAKTYSQGDRVALSQVGLAEARHAGEAQSLLFEAAKGHDTALSQTALKYLAEIGGSSSRQLS